MERLLLYQLLMSVPNVNFIKMQFFMIICSLFDKINEYFSAES